MASPNPALPTLLDELSDRGGRWFLRSRLREALINGLPRALTTMTVAALVTLASAVGHTCLGTPLPRLEMMAFLTLVLPAVYLGVALVLVLRRHPTRGQALAIYDQRLGLEDRLQTADAFLRRAEQTPFTEAAVADALPSAERAAEKELYWSWDDSTLERRVLLVPLLALLCLLGAFFMPPHREAGAAVAEQESPVPAAVEPPMEPGDPPEREQPRAREEMAERPVVAKTPQPPPTGQPPSEASVPRPAEKTVDDDEIRETEGMTEGGQYSDAKSSGRSDRSQGASGNQSPPSRPVQQEKPKVKSAKKTPRAEKFSKPHERVKDRSGATSGRGSSSGSSRNPASTDWSSKDRVEETQDEELEQEEQVDDEEMESEARGGLQPNLRDRRPPVNRDLSIGFGNRLNPDANGRGGPGQRKKSRGVASLVLGVPVPDHVKGQANPGRVKITQERIQPKAERSDPVPSEDRGERQAPYGIIPQRELDPGTKRLVRDFFQRDWETSDYLFP